MDARSESPALRDRSDERSSHLENLGQAAFALSIMRGMNEVRDSNRDNLVKIHIRKVSNTAA
jgi:hypothetical protein